MEEDKTTQTGIRPMTEGDAPAPKPCTKELHRRGGYPEHHPIAEHPLILRL